MCILVIWNRSFMVIFSHIYNKLRLYLSARHPHLPFSSSSSSFRFSDNSLLILYYFISDRFCTWEKTCDIYHSEPCLSHFASCPAVSPTFPQMLCIMIFFFYENSLCVWECMCPHVHPCVRCVSVCLSFIVLIHLFAGHLG